MIGNLKLYFCQMGFNRLEEIKFVGNTQAMLPVVDQVIYVDGSYGEDGTEHWLFTEFPENSPITVIRSKWSDDFPGQRNQYLDMVGTLRQPNEDSWVLVSDTDEIFSPLLANNIRKIIESAREDNDMILVRCKSVTIDKEGEIVYAKMDDFYKPLIFRYYPNTKYWADRSNITDNKTALHEALQVNGNFVWKPIELDDQTGKLYYEHIKLEHIIWERGCRNFIVFGGGPNLGNKQPLWAPFRALLDGVFKRSDYTSYEVLEYFRKGNIDSSIKYWLVDHRQEDGYDGASEVRECFLTYFILYHPEEMPAILEKEYQGLMRSVSSGELYRHSMVSKKSSDPMLWAKEAGLK